MIEIKLHQHKKARVWINELPNLHLGLANVIERTVPVDRMLLSGVHKAAVELLIPTGGRALYGLLGAEFVPHERKTLEIQVPMPISYGELVSWSLASQIDEVRVNTLPDFAYAILDGAFNAKEFCLLGSGELCFNCVAQGAVGSSQNVFRQLAKIVVKLLFFNEEEIVEEEIAVLLENWNQ